VSGVSYDWTDDAEGLRLAAMENPASISFEITGANGTKFRIGYKVPDGHHARIVSQLENHDHEPDMVEQFAMDKPVRVDLAPRYLLMVYGIEVVPDGEDFPDQPGEPDE